MATKKKIVKKKKKKESKSRFPIKVEKSPTETILVEPREFKGTLYIDARINFFTNDGELRPTKKGLSLTPELAEEVANAILAACEQAKGDE